MVYKNILKLLMIVPLSECPCMLLTPSLCSVLVSVQPDESFSDDFLFPMTSRLSYTSSPESDGEFCGDETPRRNTSSRSSHSQVKYHSSDSEVKYHSGDIQVKYRLEISFLVTVRLNAGYFLYYFHFNKKTPGYRYPFSQSVSESVSQVNHRL